MMLITGANGVVGRQVMNLLLHEGGPIPSRITVHRVLIRHGLVDPTPRRRRREDYRRWERGRPMELWQMDIVGGIRLADGGEAKVVTGVDDHSRFCVIAAVVRRATGRAVCLAFAEALQRFGVPEEVLTDNGKPFTARFGRGGGEVMFDRICRENGISHRLTKPRSPTTTGKVERFHQTLQRELLDDVEVWANPEEAQAAIDGFRHEYNTERPHQSLAMAFPVDRFAPSPADEHLPPRLPPALTATIPAPRQPLSVAPASAPSTDQNTPSAPTMAVVDDVGLAVEVTRLVPASGNLTVCGQQFWLSPTRAGLPVTLWADTTVVHLLIDGVRLKTVPSRLTPRPPAAAPRRRRSTRRATTYPGIRIHAGGTPRQLPRIPGHRRSTHPRRHRPRRNNPHRRSRWHHLPRLRRRPTDHRGRSIHHQGRR
ncbi:DDE-type integrase/transposase/recombinase [Plantactinospora sonchi]|uniref:DDE-type integrase/transposase/recombinase n=1 Tax=Plantactinospora sonchi TaxID=1544735 RepID=A0ABU7RSM3_9ACTN